MYNVYSFSTLLGQCQSLVWDLPKCQWRLFRDELSKGGNTAEASTILKLNKFGFRTTNHKSHFTTALCKD